jgi:hypothetical protein
MTTKHSNLVILFLCASFVIYRLIHPADPNDNISSVIGNLSLNIIAAILLYIFLQILKNIKHIWLYINTQLLLHNKEIRLSVSYLFRIKVDNKYLLVRNRTRDYFQPVGGAFKTLPGSERIFEKLGIKPDRLIETEKGIAKNDLRLYLKGCNVVEFLEWFNSKEDRETSPWREFCEELVSTGILPSKEFRYIDYKYKGTVQTPIIKLDNGDNGMFLFEIYDLVINDEQKPILEALLQAGDTDKYIWADEYLINRLGHDERQKSYTYEISKHTKWALNIKYTK